MWFETGLTLLVVPHVDAGDRNAWTDDQDVRPLSELGRRQAAELADEVGVVDAVYSSPARRCVETVEPIAFAAGLSIIEMEELRELTYVDDHRTWEPWNMQPPFSDWVLASAGLGRITRAAAAIASRHADQRVVVCAHGDLVPLLAVFAAAHLGAPLPPPIARGGAYEVSRSTGVRTLGAVFPPPG